MTTDSADLEPQDTGNGEEPVLLRLTDAPHKHRHSLASTLHTLLSTFALFLHIPCHLIWHYLLVRRSSGVVQEIGRPALHETAVLLVRHLFLKSYLAPARLVFALALPSKWVRKVEVAGTKGRWIAKPGTTEEDRKDDELVMLWIHGGGFFVDTDGACLPFFIQLTKTLNVNRATRFSIFAIDYQLAPEKIYPSQLTEISAAYHYLVNDLGIPEKRICVGGDSAGGNLAVAFLLHLARPNPQITVPKSLGPTPGKPGSAFIVSPFINLVSYAPSRSSPYDYIDSGGVFHGSLSYIGAVHPYPPEVAAWLKTASPSWNPLRWFSGASSAAPEPEGLVKAGLSAGKAEKEGKGLVLLSSPYVNPNPQVLRDWTWYKEAFPGEGKTLVTWGGKEIFADDVTAFVEALKDVGVAPTELVKPLGVHDWVLFDSIVPSAAKDKLGGEQAKPDYGIRMVADFMQARATDAKE
ncbi:hypothetical protein JCM10213_001283 [Rhodosporidiobolus nylandii]